MPIELWVWQCVPSCLAGRPSLQTDNRVAKIPRLQQGRYMKQLDTGREMVVFDLGECQIEFDFSAIWFD